MTHRLLARAVALAVFVLASGGAAAEPPEDPVAQAKAAFERGKAEYAAGRYEQALAEFTTSYNLTSRPAILFNLGMCAEQLGQRERAVAYYRLYLEEIPDAQDAQDVKARIASLETPQQASAEPSPQAAAPIEAAPPELPPEYTAAQPDARRKTLAPALLTGLGALVLAGGIVTAIAANNEYESLEQSCAPGCSTSDVDRVRGAAIAADVQLFLGGAAAVAGGTWLIVQRMRKRSESKSVQFAPAPAGIVFSGRWP